MMRTVESRKDESIQFLKALISADTTNEQHGVFGKELNGQKLIIEKLTKMGLQIDTFEPEYEKLKKYDEADIGHEYKNRPNVVGIYKGSGGGKSLLLNGHIDTMPFDQLDKWVTHPLEPIINNGKLYGRGSCDMKAGVAAMILALETLLDNGVELKGDVIIESVVDEEGGGNGTLACVDKGYLADAAIVTEPTQLEIMPAHMGWLFYKVEISGRSLHSALKWKGVNAIEKAIKVIQGLQELEEKWAITKRHPLLPPPTINIGTIHGGMAGSVVPDTCILDFGLHYLPTDSDAEGLGKDVEKEIFAVINNIVNGDPWLQQNPPIIKKYQEGSSFEISKDHPIVETVSKQFVKNMGLPPTIRGCEYGSDARLLKNYGKIPTVVFGPGSIEQAHAINEFVPVDEFLKSIEILAGVIEEWCNTPNER
jgi:acetylornithine deacetylase